ncbi:MAG: DUF3667 domain-containing protein, partial [Gemmatimonadota bacterium]|nr:DUF3667 domain-containing protein [Gemmatimonadota bacterium]
MNSSSPSNMTSTTTRRIPLAGERMMSDSNPAEIATDATADGSTCPNCGRERHEHFCPQCGQNDRVYAREIGSVTSEFVRETFEVDSRLYRTLKLLLFKPGRLTTEFSRNRRASYMSPVRLYIFASFLFFLVLSLSGTLDSPKTTVRDSGDHELVARQGPTDERGVAFVAELPDPIERFFLFAGIDPLHDPSVTGERIISNLPIAMFFLLPLYALILAAFYIRKERFLVEHLVFAIHVQTFVFIAYTVSLLVSQAGPISWIGPICLLIQYPYFVIALRRYYG